MLLALARSVGDVDEAEMNKLVQDFTFQIGERLSPDEENEIARRLLELHNKPDEDEREGSSNEVSDDEDDDDSGGNSS